MLDCHLDILKTDNGQSKNGRWKTPFKKFNELRVIKSD